jgi:hypothetical protein
LGCENTYVYGCGLSEKYAMRPLQHKDATRWVCDVKMGLCERGGWMGRVGAEGWIGGGYELGMRAWRECMGGVDCDHLDVEFIDIAEEIPNRIIIVFRVVKQHELRI